ncbi:MAG: transcription termination factor NusA [Eubacteriales bacterium]
MNSEFFAALDELEQKRGISKAYMLEKIEAALVAAYKKEYGNNTNVRIHIDESKKDVRVFQQKEVVAEVEDPETQISVEEAKTHNKRMTVGKVLETEVKPKNFRRLSAGAARSVIIQAIREAERKISQEAYEAKREEIITVTVSKIDEETGDVIIFTGNGYARLRKSEQIPGEEFFIGQKIKIYISEVNREARGPLITISRAHPGLIRRMFELEVPEIQEGIVTIKGIAREAGSRTKIAVHSEDEGVDPVGSCVGTRGVRINSILGELDGEKVDIVKYSEDTAEYIAAALAPATVESVTMLGEKTAHVVVRPDQLSLAIGREGQNARLAARLTGCKIDIKPE